MVKLTASLISCKVSRSKLLHGQERKEKDPDKRLKKLTHLRLHDQNIDYIEDISQCRNLSVLYLHNNRLEKINNLQYATNLTHIYLQNNKISKLENLESARKLKKLYLGRNCIAVVEGLENLECLEELHVEKQQLPPGESIYFDPRTVSALANTLRVLNVSKNNLSTLADLASLTAIEYFIAKDNKLSNIKDIVDTIKLWICIKSIELQGNPVCLQHKYRATVIVAASPTLVSLDDKYITEITRNFLKQLSYSLLENKTAKPKRKDPAQGKIEKEVETLAHHFPAFIKQTISKSVIKDSLGIKTLSPVKTSMFPAWNIQRAKDMNVKKLSPPPFRKKNNIAALTSEHSRKQVKISSSLPQI